MAAAAGAGGGGGGGGAPVFNQDRTDELLRMIPNEIRLSAANELYLLEALEHMKSFIDAGADPSGGPHGSTLKVILDATSGRRGKYCSIGQAFMEFLLKRGANPNHTFTYKSFKIVKRPYLEIVNYDSELTHDEDAAIFKSWFELLAKYGFDFNKPDLALATLGTIADNPIGTVKRASAVLAYFASKNAPMDGVEEFIDESFGLYSGHNTPEEKETVKNALRRNAFMRMGIGSEPNLPSGIKAKIASAAFKKAGGGRQKMDSVRFLTISRRSGLRRRGAGRGPGRRPRSSGASTRRRLK